MESSGKASIPPEQRTGVQKDLQETVTFESLDDAEDMFVIAKGKLLDVNGWHEVNKHIGTKFHLVDGQKRPLRRHARKGDLITIDIPGPGSGSGERSDWVRIEALEYDDYPDDHREVIAMRLRPVRNPSSPDEAAAHFFSDEATSTFIIERDHKKLTAQYHGRNELPNTEAEALLDKARNLLVAAGGMLGLSDINWSGLLKGFIEEEEGI